MVKIFLLTLIIVNSLLASDKKLKDVSKAVRLSAIIPGAGQFYLGNTWKGVRDLSIETGLVGMTTLFIILGTKAQKDTARIKAFIGAGLFGISALIYHGIQIALVHDDAVAHNYKKKFLSYRFDLIPEKRAVCLKAYRLF